MFPALIHLCPEMHAMTRMADLAKRAPRLTMLVKLPILAIFCQFRQISLSIRIDTTWVNIGDFGKIGKIANFGDRLPIFGQI